MAENRSGSGFWVHFVLPMALVAILAIWVGRLPWSLDASWFGSDKLPKLEDRLAMLGTFGDMFGFLNATFSGVAFAAIYYTLRIQQKQHNIQESEFNMKKEIAYLVVDENDSKEIFQTTVPGGASKAGEDRPQCPARYVRLALKNDANLPARGCRVMLTAIEKKKPGEEFAVMKESKLSLRLLQFTEEDHSPEEKSFTIPHNLPQYFNVCSMKSEPPDHQPFGLLQLAHGQSKYKNLGKNFELGCDYRFHISVDSENSTPLAVKMTVSLGNDLEKLRVDKIEVERKKGRVFYAE